MKFLKLDYVKAHSRIDYNDEDALLELYINSAEETVMNYIDRTYEEMLEVYGDIPEPVRQATMMLVDHSYQQRSPISAQNFSTIPYGFDVLIKPYMRLSSDSHQNCYKQVVLGSQIKIAFSTELPDGLTMEDEDVDFEVVVRNFSDKDKFVKATKEECIPLCDNEYVVLVDTDDLGIGVLRMKVTLKIPDSDYPEGYRKEVRNINPRITIKG